MHEIEIQWSNKKSLCVVLCSNGCPDSYKKNVEIENLSEIKLNSDEYLFHAGTIKKNNKLYAIGGRVLNFVTTSENFHSAKKSIHKNLEKLEWSGGFYRKDIGHKVIEI